MKPKSDKTTVVNKHTGKNLQQMTWDEIRSLKGKSVSRNEFIQQIKQSKTGKK